MPASGHRTTESSGGSFYSGREPLGLHNSWPDKPVGQSVHPHHIQQHDLPSSSDPYRENRPVTDFPPPHSREFKPPVPNLTVEKEKKKKLGDLVPPLCASRLKPIRQKTKNAVVSFICLSFSSLICHLHILAFLTGEHPGHGGSVYGVVKMSWWPRESKGGPTDFL